MTVDDFTCRQCDRTGLLQHRVQSDQYAGLHNGGGFLNFNHITVFQCFDEIGLHISIGLTLGLLVFRTAAELLDFVRNLFEYKCHTILCCSIFFFFACQRLIYTCGIIIHIVKIGQVHQFCYIGIVNTAHCFERFLLFIQLSISRRNRISLGEDHSDKVENLCAGRTGVLHIRQIQPCSNRFCTHCLTGSGRTTKQEITHLRWLTGRDTGVLTDIYHLFRDDIPGWQLRYE